jgi:hypothetical protein
VVRWSMLIGGAVISIAASVGGGLLFFRSVEERLGCGRTLTGWQRLVVLVILIFAPAAAGWMLLDWNLLALGIGRTPAYAGVGLSLLTACLLWWRSLPLRTDIVSSSTKAIHIVPAWCLSAGTLISILVWFRHGVMWGM